jgi:hypothetical protein
MWSMRSRRWTVEVRLVFAYTSRSPASIRARRFGSSDASGTGVSKVDHPGFERMPSPLPATVFIAGPDGVSAISTSHRRKTAVRGGAIEEGDRLVILLLYRGEEASATSYLAHGLAHGRKSRTASRTSPIVRTDSESWRAWPAQAAHPSRGITDSRTVARGVEHPLHATPSSRSVRSWITTAYRYSASSSSFSESTEGGVGRVHLEDGAGRGGLSRPASGLKTTATSAPRGRPRARRRYDCLASSPRQCICRVRAPCVRAGERPDGRHQLRRHPLGEVTSELAFVRRRCLGRWVDRVHPVILPRGPTAPTRDVTCGFTRGPGMPR